MNIKNFTYEYYREKTLNDLKSRWDGNITLNCDDMNRIEEARKKVFKQRLEELKEEQKDLTVEEIVKILTST